MGHGLLVCHAYPSLGVEIFNVSISQRTISPFILWKVQDSNLRCPTPFIAVPSIKPSATYPVCLRPLGQPSMMSLILMSLIVSLSFESFKTCEPHGWQAILSNKINNSSLLNIVAAATQRFVKVNSCITYLYISLCVSILLSVRP